MYTFIYHGTYHYKVHHINAAAGHIQLNHIGSQHKKRCSLTLLEKELKSGNVDFEQIFIRDKTTNGKYKISYDKNSNTFDMLNLNSKMIIPVTLNFLLVEWDAGNFVQTSTTANSTMPPGWPFDEDDEDPSADAPASYGESQEPPGGLYRPCLHEWAIYDSGWTRYQYCKKCDIKRTEQ